MGKARVRLCIAVVLLMLASCNRRVAIPPADWHPMDFNACRGPAFVAAAELRARVDAVLTVSDEGIQNTFGEPCSGATDRARCRARLKVLVASAKSGAVTPYLATRGEEAFALGAASMALSPSRENAAFYAALASVQGYGEPRCSEMNASLTAAPAIRLRLFKDAGSCSPQVLLVSVAPWGGIRQEALWSRCGELGQGGHPGR